MQLKISVPFSRFDQIINKGIILNIIFNQNVSIIFLLLQNNVRGMDQAKYEDDEDVSARTCK